MRELQPTLRASELVARLSELIESAGDVPVYLEDPDTEWPLGVRVEVGRIEGVDAPHLAIRADYHAAPIAAGKN